MMTENQNPDRSSQESESNTGAPRESETRQDATAADIKNLASEIGEAKLKGIEKEVAQRLAGTMSVIHRLFENALGVLSGEAKDSIRNTEEIKNLISGVEPTFTSEITSNTLKSRRKFAKVVESAVDVVTKIELQRAINRKGPIDKKEPHAHAQEFFNLTHKALEKGASEIRKAREAPKKDRKWKRILKPWLRDEPDSEEKSPFQTNFRDKWTEFKKKWGSFWSGEHAQPKETDSTVRAFGKWTERGFLKTVDIGKAIIDKLDAGSPNYLLKRKK